MDTGGNEEMRRLSRLMAATTLVLAACGGSEVGDDTIASTVATTTAISSTTTSTAQATTTIPAINVLAEVRSYLIESISAEVEGFVDERLAEAGATASYSVSVVLDRDPVVELSVSAQADADVLNEVVGEISILDNSVVYQLMGGANVPSLSGDESFASLQLPPAFLGAGFLDDLGGLMTDLGLPSSTVARMENTRALDGTQTADGDGISASWTYHPDDGLSVILERR